MSSLGYISYFTNSAYFSDADLQYAIPDFQSQVANEFNYYWGLYAFMDDSGAGTPVFITDAGSDQGGVLGFHTNDQGSPYAIVWADQCVQYGVPITGVVSHETLEMMADPLGDEVDLYDNGDGTGYIVDQEVCDPCEMSLYYEAPNGNLVSDFITPAWFVPGDPGPYDFLGQIGAPWQLASGGYVCYQDVTLSGLICDGAKVQKARAKAGKAIKSNPNPLADAIYRLQLNGKKVQKPPKNAPSTIVRRKDVPMLGRPVARPHQPPEAPAAPPAKKISPERQFVTDGM
ncbi:MAG: hypothetical protein JO270_20305 [Acidobacteriaceae bacterium]|nr:hypothetical protein [Acidobacteriaceae bacterium]MBV8570614.1 hypothetical protein [Acidobacteriaceae bacterium]